MKKHVILPLYGRISLALLLLAVVFIVHSCRKEVKLTKQQINAEVAAAHFPVNDAMSWFNGNKVALSSKIKINSDASFLNKIADFTPIWDSARTAVDTNYYVVEAPAKYVTKLGFANDSSANNVNGITRLLVLKSKKSGNLSAVLMHIHGDVGVNIQKAHYMDLPEHFSGNIFYTSVQGAFINGYVYKDGKIILVSTGNSSGTRPAGPQILQEYVPGYCVSVQIDWYTQTCWVEHDGSIERCTEWTYDHTDYYNYCVPAQGVPPSGGPSPTDPECPPGTGGGSNPPVNVESVKGKIVVRFVDPGTGGGDNPCTPTPPPVDIINKVKDPCLHAMVDQVTNKGITTVINGLIQNVFGRSTKVNVRYEDTHLEAGQKGYTPPPASLDADGNLTVTVYLNQDELPQASQEYIATVIMHETIHAYLTTVNLFGQIQHDDIAGIFANQMALDLQQMFPALNSADAFNLAWGGLQSTDAFQTTIGSDMTKLGKFDATQSAFSAGNKGTKCSN